MHSGTLALDYSKITNIAVSKIPWSEYEDQQLRQMTVDGMNRREMSEKLKRSTAAIARRCKKLGLTRGKGNHALVQATMKALKFKNTGPNGDLKPKGEPDLSAIAPSMLAIINKPAPKRNQHNCDIMELTRTKCRWPYGDPQKPGFFFCGAPVEGVKSYCTKHCNQAYYGRTQVQVRRTV